MYQIENYPGDNLFDSKNSIEDIEAYIFSVFNEIETKLIPLEDKILELQFELKEDRRNTIDGVKDNLKTSFDEDRSDFGFPSFFKETTRTSKDIEQDLVRVDEEFSAEFFQVKEKLKCIFVNESSEFRNKISKIKNPRQLLGLVSRAFECIEDHCFEVSPLDAPSFIVASDGSHYHTEDKVSFSTDTVLETSCANFIRIKASKGFETAGSLLMENRNGHLEIKGLGVNASLRREGIGSDLLEQAVSYARKTNSSLSIVVPETNVGAQIFLSENDFKAKKTYANYFAGEVDGYFMTRYIS